MIWIWTSVCRQGFPPNQRLMFDGVARKDPSYPSSPTSVHSHYQIEDWHYDLFDCCVEPCLCAYPALLFEQSTQLYFFVVKLFLNLMRLSIGSWSLWFSVGLFAYNINVFLSTCGICLEVVSELEWRTTYFGSLKIKFSLAPLGMRNWVWASMNWDRMFLVQTSTLSPSIHWKLTEHGRVFYAKQPTPNQKSWWIRGYLYYLRTVIHKFRVFDVFSRNDYVETGIETFCCPCETFTSVAASATNGETSKWLLHLFQHNISSWVIGCSKFVISW